MSDFGKKRLEAVLAIASYSIGSGTASSVPTPGGEIPRQLILTASDILMYISIWRIYFQEDLSRQGLLDILAELGLVTVSATGTAYIVSKATTAILKEITNWTGPLGWGVTAAIAGSLSGLFGVVWALYCDRLASEREIQP
ncbi:MULTISPECIES: hypothetical protein [unclassified Nodularia (in: cyanobacteria)]|uniref:hypothetical protein n=1 Tax=unclassified Nodularia (in: cyanobacteria) TaxID=2656917 RepID=UPI0018819EFD|nr:MULTISPECIES: hypothetical protein [unclassified Nodularia (in: cyanobacteria)]MBE9200681.1 hypothetical protein [Nodularia sp. LEGE 06071]MCC2694788.1 hypothetical protein [Nodularia sp. LEGE 04288]